MGQVPRAHPGATRRPPGEQHHPCREPINGRRGAAALDAGPEQVAAEARVGDVMLQVWGQIDHDIAHENPRKHEWVLPEAQVA